MSCDAKWLVLRFSAPFLIFIIRMIRYWDDKIKWDLKGSIKFVWSYMTNMTKLYIIWQSCFETVFNFIFLYKNTVDSKKKLRFFATCFILYVICSDGEIYFTIIWQSNALEICFNLIWSKKAVKDVFFVEFLFFKSF